MSATSNNLRGSNSQANLTPEEASFNAYIDELVAADRKRYAAEPAHVHVVEGDYRDIPGPVVNRLQHQGALERRG